MVKTEHVVVANTRFSILSFFYLLMSPPHEAPISFSNKRSHSLYLSTAGELITEESHTRTHTHTYTPRAQPLIKASVMALICNNVYKSLWAWWEEAFLNGCSPWVHPRHCLIDAGPPGPPDKVSVEEITDSTAQLSWTPGRDNGSPITGYIIQARTPFTVGWQAVDTGTLKRGFCSIYFAWIFICSSFSWSPVV